MIDEKKLILHLNDWMFQESYMRSLRNAEDVISECIEAVKEQPKIDEWIPCNKRLPEIGTGEFLVCLENGGIFMAIFVGGEFKEISTLGMKEFCENNPVVAWKPLPEPFDEEMQELDMEDKR